MHRKAVPKKIKDTIEKIYGGRCAFKDCNIPAVVLHHIKRFAYTKDHDANCILPLCKIHHELAHSGLIENEQLAPGHWRLRPLNKLPLQFDVDKKWEKHKLFKEDH